MQVVTHTDYPMIPFLVHIQFIEIYSLNLQII